ncbi:TadE/TadG family type IV pilus assembly protein [Sphingomonas carotinifaciens]|uniref:TadE/TadG family type IV pilus assembly protein n=1 Tax=Sphingomonas carotinifaciens TaxID=1166323 RepID=UPI00399F9242
MQWLRLRLDRRGIALVEFALIFPILLTLCLTGAEITNFIITKMRVSQLALQLADNAARMGAGSPLAAKIITETDINDLFVGANLQSGGLDLRTNGRAILSDLEQDPANAGRFRIVWQRCYGQKVARASSYGTAGTNNMTGIGPAGRQATALPNSATMFVEVYYVYPPLVSARLAPATEITEIASMAVRERRDLSGINNVQAAPVSTC